MQFLQSDLVRVRRARWRVTDSRVYTHCQLLTLVGVDAFNARLERRILAPFDTVEHVERRPRPERISLRAWRRACRALIASESPPGGLRCARRARIELLPHQLEPALAIVRGLGSRVLLADAVGLGKTIQAGLIVSELRTLGAADRVLILTPAGLRDQWARELAERFDLHATILDARSVARSVATLPVGVNPWRMASVAIASIDYVKRPDVLTSVAACRSDVLIVDEAHGVAGDSDRHAAVAALASRSPFVVLLTATPHSGDRDAFRTLCRLGAVDAHAVDTHLWGPPSGGPIELKPDPTGQRPTTDDQLLVFRRTQADVRLGTARRIHRLLVRPSAAEARMHELLARFSLTVQREHGTTRPGSPANPGLWLALSVLHKRALSSAWSLQRSVERRLAALASADHDGGDHEGQLPLPFDEAAGEFSAADQPPPWSSALTLRDASHERQMLAELAAAATAAARRETKMGALGRLLRRIDEPAIVFTEYRDTLMHLRASIEGRASVLHGGLTRRERLEAIDEFTHGTSTVLLATDAAAEGLNLHHGCRSVINLELPWNPMRLEQRIGRVDRIGQTRTVHAFHLIAAGSSEPRILARLQRRLARAQADIGAPDPLGMDGSMDDEDAIARSIIEQSDVASAFRRTPDAEDVVRLKADPTNEWVNENVAVEDFVTPALATEATAEADRIGRARATVRAGDEDLLAQLDGRGPHIARARRSKTRAALGRRVLMLWRVSLNTNAAAVRASVLVPLTIQLLGDAIVSDTCELLRRLDADLRRQGDLATLSWQRRAADVHRVFIGTRLDRERAIGTTDASAPTIFQPGLFDRRHEQARLAILASEGDRRIERAATIAAFEQAAVPSPADAELLLVLMP